MKEILELTLTKIRAYWPVGLLFCVVLTGTLYGVARATILLAATLLVIALGLIWTSLGELTREEPLSLDEALEVAAPEQGEQEKVSLLRALKDLEQEHRFGKITNSDFAAESSRMRQEAKRLLASYDESSKERRTRVEGRIKRHLKDKSQPRKRVGRTPSDSTKTQAGK